MSYDICNLSFKEKQMSDKIEIKVTINDKPATLADVSPETLGAIRRRTQPTVKPIEHGDYGYISHPNNHRLFTQKDGVIVAYCRNGECLRNGADVNHPAYRKDYTITGNIFKDMRNGKS